MKRLIAAAAMMMLVASPTAAIDLDDLSDAEREAFREEVRAYLLDNPEVLMEAIGILEQRQNASAQEAEAMAVTANADLLYNSQFDWVGGNPDGDIVLVEFLDYRCGFCRRAHPEVDALIEQDGNIRLVVKEFPILGEESVLASEFAIATRIALGDDAYATVHDELMELRGSVTEASLTALAEGAGLDSQAIFASIEDPIVQATIEANHMLGQRLGISGTPSFVFEEQLVRGYVPLDSMVELVASLRATAE